MKKSTFMFGVMSFALLAFVSCRKTTQNFTSFTATTTQFEGVESEDKAYLDPALNVYFEQGDIVRMFNISSTPSQSECADYAAKTTGMFVRFDAVENMTVSPKGDFYAFFPGGENVVPNLANENRVTFKLSPVQRYYEVNGTPSFAKDAMYMAAKSSTNGANIENANFNFQNICGVLRLKYYDSNGWTIRSIRVEDKHFHLSGDVNLKIDKVTSDGLVALCQNYNPANPAATATQIAEYKDLIGYNVTNAGTSITLDFGDTGFALTNDANNPDFFYFVLRPLALAHGYRVIITDMDGVEHLIVDSNSDRKITPGMVRSIAAKDLKPFH